jgi:hypothetical protein
MRVVVLFLALTTVLVGWPLERHVGELRHVRNQASDQVMQDLKWAAAAPSDPVAMKAVDEARAASAAARKDFASWHVLSLMLNMVTIALVTVAMALTAQLPPGSLPITVKKPSAIEKAKDLTSYP